MPRWSEPSVRPTAAAKITEAVLQEGTRDVEDQNGQAHPRTNRARRAIGFAVCFTPFALLLASLGASLEFPRKSEFGIGLAAAGLLVAGFNFYVATIRPALYAWRHGSTKG